MATALRHSERKDLARPLKALVPLIRDDLDHAESAGMPYYRAAGEKLLEAKEQLSRGEFGSWVTRHFPISLRTAERYMKYAEAEGTEKRRTSRFSSMSEFIRETSDSDYNRPQSWEEPVRKIVSRVDTETLNLKREELKRADEREAQRQLAAQLIDIGYKVLARKLHPDRGGSRDAMTRLNAVRDRLKGCI